MINIVLAIFFGWLVVLTFMIYTVRKHYLNLITRTKKRTIDEILDVLLTQENIIKKEQEVIKNTIYNLKNEIKLSYHTIGIVRFNAFEKIQGERSFVLALLNSVKSGIVLNFIYTQEGFKIYTKMVTEGKSDEYELSEEEKDAILKAK